MYTRGKQAAGVKFYLLDLNLIVQKVYTNRPNIGIASILALNELPMPDLLGQGLRLRPEPGLLK